LRLLQLSPTDGRRAIRVAPLRGTLKGRFQERAMTGKGRKRPLASDRIRETRNLLQIGLQQAVDRVVSGGMCPLICNAR
jgi:hypothetical protein